MRSILLVVWLALPVAALGYHFGPGQEQLALDKADSLLAQADTLVAEQRWAEAIEAYNAALAVLPAANQPAIRRSRLERAKAQMFVQQLPEAHTELESLLEELLADSQQDPALIRDTRSALANSQYYLTWLMRLEGEPREVWEPEIDAARQHLRLLTEEAEKSQNASAAEQHAKDLEAVIRLARMNLGDLQGMSLPCQCSGCKSGKCKKPNGRKPKQDRKDARGAGFTEPVNGKGH